MRTPNLIATIAGWMRLHWKPIILLSLLPPIGGILCYHFVGGRIAEVAGGIQFIFFCGYLFFGMVLVLFGSYGPKVNGFLEFWPVAFVRIVGFILVTVLALYGIGFTICSIATPDGQH